MMQEMDQRLQLPHTDWTDLELCIFVSTRIETLLKQISAFHITKDCQFNIDIIQERLRIIGQTFDEEQRELLDEEQEEIIALLRILTESIDDGDLASVIDEVITAAKENLEQIQRLCWTGNPELAKDVEKAIKSTISKEEGMRALIIGLVHEIISLFGPGLNQLDLLMQHEFSNYFVEESFRELENIGRLNNAVTSTRRNFQPDEKEQFLNCYLGFISRLDFAGYFPFQPCKGEEYKNMQMTIKALGDLLHSHNQLLHVIAVTNSELADARSNLENEEANHAEEVAKLGHENVKLLDEIARLSRQKSTLSSENAQEKAEMAERIKEMNAKEKKNKKAWDALEVRKNILESELEVFKDKYNGAQNRINEITRERNHLKNRLEELKLKERTKSMRELIKNSQTWVHSLRQPQASEAQLVEISDALDSNLMAIDDIVRSITARSVVPQEASETPVTKKEI